MRDLNRELDNIINWMLQYKKQTSCKGVCLGLSGGKDSTVVAMLSKVVFGDNVMALLMPNGEQKDISDSIDIAEKLGINYRIVNIETVYNSLVNVIENKVVEINGSRDFAENCKPITEKAKTNIPPRLRMTTLYAVAQTYGYRVIGTGNASESYIGWCTKFGDTGCDFNPIANLTCTEVKVIGRFLASRLSLDDDFVSNYIDKAPADGLTGKTDEDNLGFTYGTLDAYIRSGLGGFTASERIDYREALDKIIQMHDSSEHKRNLPYTTENFPL